MNLFVDIFSDFTNIPCFNRHYLFVQTDDVVDQGCFFPTSSLEGANPMLTDETNGGEITSSPGSLSSLASQSDTSMSAVTTTNQRGKKRQQQLSTSAVTVNNKRARSSKVKIVEAAAVNAAVKKSSSSVKMIRGSLGSESSCSTSSSEGSSSASFGAGLAVHSQR